ncbi:MAG: tyrosine-type recombinase/integrase [Bryobacteraceae bacterium]
MIEAENHSRQKSKDRDGLYKRREYWHYELIIDGKKRSFTSGTKDYNQAKKKRAAALRELQEGRALTDSGRRRFELAADEYIAHRQSTVSPGTVRLEKERLKPLKRGIGNRMLRDITSRAIREYQGSRAREVSPRTVNLEVKLLRGILKAEGQWKRLMDDVRPLKESGESAGRALTPEEAVKLFETAETKPEWMVAYLATVIANDTGMRGVELRNLRLCDVDVEKRALTIRKSKNESGLRTVVLTNDAVNALLKLLDRAALLNATRPEHFVIPAKVKGGYDPTRPTKGWRTAWRSLRRTAGLGKFRFHDLRHTFVTTHAEMGTPLPVLMEQAGHLSAKMTRLYTHISQKAMQKAAENFERVKLERLAEARKEIDRRPPAQHRVN